MTLFYTRPVPDQLIYCHSGRRCVFSQMLNEAIIMFFIDLMPATDRRFHKVAGRGDSMFMIHVHSPPCRGLAPPRLGL